MGWLWSTSKPAAVADASSAAASGAAPSAAAAASSTPTSTAPPPASTTSTSSSKADGYDDPELRKFVDMFQATAAPAPTPTETPAPSSSAAPTATAPDYPIRERSLGDALLPTSMSCRQAFDLAWACQSPAGQWRAVYRHGSVQPCSRLWDDFWFCMRVRGGGSGGSGGSADDIETDARARAVRDHYRARELERYYAPGQPSSEDVWRSRTRDEVLPPGAVFQHAFQVAGDARSGIAQNDDKGGKDSSSSPDPASRKDADEILADMERRRKIRQQIGYSS